MSNRYSLLINDCVDLLAFPTNRFLKGCFQSILQNLQHLIIAPKLVISQALHTWPENIKREQATLFNCLTRFSGISQAMWTKPCNVVFSINTKFKRFITHGCLFISVLLGYYRQKCTFCCNQEGNAVREHHFQLSSSIYLASRSAARELFSLCAVFLFFFPHATKIR